MTTEFALEQLPHPPKNRHGLFEEFCPHRETVCIGDRVELLAGAGDRAGDVVGVSELPASGTSVLLLADGRFVSRDRVVAIQHDSRHDRCEPWRVFERWLARSKSR